MNIDLVRGEEFPVEFSLQDESGTSIQAEEIVVTCRKAPYKDSPILFQKKLSENEISYSDDKYTFDILEDDTKDLEYGIYGYDIKVSFDGLIEKFVGDITINKEYNNEYSSNSQEGD